MQTSDKERIRQELVSRLSNSEFIVDAVHRAAKKALEDHKRTGDPVAGWQDEHVIWIAADDIHIEESVKNSKE